MDEIQILEKLFNMIGAAGEGAFTLAILWIATGYFYAILFLTGAIIISGRIIKLIYRYGSEEIFFEQLAKSIGTRGPLYDYEKNKILDIIRESRETK